MPRQDLKPDEVLALTAFLKAQQASNVARAPLATFVSNQQQRPEWLLAEPKRSSSLWGSTAARLGLNPEDSGLTMERLGLTVVDLDLDRVRFDPTVERFNLTLKG